MRYLIVIALLVGCGPEIDHSKIQTTCQTKGLGIVMSEVRFDCAVFASNFLLARQIMDERGLVPFEKSETAFSRVIVEVKDVENWALPELDSKGLTDHSVDGETTLFADHIFMSHSGGALVHELLHVWQTQHLVVDTSSHPKWDTNGYYAADQAYDGQDHDLRDP